MPDLSPHAEHDPAPSKAALLGHPIHPMLIAYPIAFLTAVVATDLAYWATADAFWARVSVWLIGAGLVTGAAAALFGIIDFLGIERARSHAAGWAHGIGNAVALALSAVNLLLRVDEPASAVLPWGLVLSVVVAALLGVTGWLGGELAYRHKIGVMADKP